MILDRAEDHECLLISNEQTSLCAGITERYTRVLKCLICRIHLRSHIGHSHTVPMVVRHHIFFQQLVEYSVFEVITVDNNCCCRCSSSPSKLSIRVLH